MKYKILYLTYHPEIGGGETMLINLLLNLNKELFEPIVVVPKIGQLSEKLKQLNIQTHILPLNGYLIRTFFVPGMSPFGIYRFLRLAKKLKPHLIHVNHLNLAVYAGFAGRLLKIPIIATSHGPWDSVYFFQDIASTIFVDKILANTEDSAHAIVRRKIVDAKKVEVIYFGIDTNYFKPGDKQQARRTLRLPQNSLIVTIVGRLDPIKDHMTFLKAALLVSKKCTDITFFIVGSKLGDFSDNRDDNSYETRIKQFVNQHSSLAKKIIWGGFIDDMPTVYHATDILVSSSLSESFGIALCEAGASGIPVVATNSGGQHLVVKNGESGYLVKPRHPEQIAQKIMQLAKNLKLRQRLGLHAKNHIVKNYPIEKYVRKVQKIYLTHSTSSGLMLSKAEALEFLK